MINNLNFKTSASLNDAFELIIKIFNEERAYYEATISSLKGKVSELEDSIIQIKKENMSYQSRISKLKGKLRSISKTVSKLEESEFDGKIENSKEAEKNDISNINNGNNSNFNSIKYRNTDILNSFRKKSKITHDINKSTNTIHNFNSHYLKMNLLDNSKLKNEEDINGNYIKKSHKKTLSTKIKNSILNINHKNIQTKSRRKKEENNMFNSNSYNEEEASFFLKNEIQNKMTVPVEKENQNNNRKKYLGKDKFNKIEQKINGLKSALSIYNKKDNFNFNDENFTNSINVQNINSKSSPYIN